MLFPYHTMKKKMFKTVRFRNKNGSYQLVEYDPDPPPLPPGWHAQVMAAIRRIGPLKKHSSTSDEPTG